ncbi:MAG: flavodoxin family protein [Deltaproteobacteria bacterium]|nr:flavodoxin family protein [Deltaproteobacteria bacterium]
MKALVTYYSDTGNTKKLAEAIYEGIKEAKKDIMPIAEVGAVDEYDVLFCGFPVQARSVPGKVASFIKKLPEGTNIAFFATHGSMRGGELAVEAFYAANQLAASLNILGTFGCRGQVKDSIIESLMKKAEHKPWAQEAQSAAGHPDQGDLEDAGAFANAMITKVRSL